MMMMTTLVIDLKPCWWKCILYNPYGGEFDNIWKTYTFTFEPAIPFLKI